MKKHPLRAKLSYLITVSLLLLLAALMGISTVVAQDTPFPSTPVPNLGSSNPGLAAALRQSGAQIAYHQGTGAARLVSAAPGQTISQPSTLRGGATGEEAARGFLTVYGSLFGINNQAAELTRKNEKKPDNIRTFERFQQVYNGVPVIGGELIVQVDNNNNILSANGETLPKIAVSTTPTVTANTAVQNALMLIAKYHNIQTSNLTASTPILSIYNPVLIGPGANMSMLVWRTEVTTVGLEPIDEFVLIDALRGEMVLHFNQVDTALSRQVYTANHTSGLPGVLLCSEGNSACGGDAHAQAAYNSAGLTYNYYFSHFGRNSIDNAGMVLKSTVHYRSGFDNAFWSGTEMVYGDARNFPQALDVAAHEMTHGVTEHESGLFYFYESGAINESLSDVFGELVQQAQPGFSGTPWLIGENLSPGFPNGYLRNMADPPSDYVPPSPSFPGIPADPDKMTSPYYLFDTNLDDNGGVHENSGVNNKAAYLMAAGGSFNGKTITGIGNDNTAKIYYEAQTNILTSGSSYADLYDALYQACFNLTRTGAVPISNCQQVRNATDAVEMNLSPAYPYYNNPDGGDVTNAPACPSGQNVNLTVFSDGLEGGTGNWTFSDGRWSGSWPFTANIGLTAHSGTKILYADDLPAVASSSFAAMKNSYLIPPNAYLRFYHHDWFEPPYYDGGIVEYSINGGASWTNLGSLMDMGGYNGQIPPQTSPPILLPHIPDTGYYSNPLAGQLAFVGNSWGFMATRANLSSLEGQNVKFRWRMGLDIGGFDYGWLLDDISIYTCGGPPANDNFANAISVNAPDGRTNSNGAASLELGEPKADCEGANNIKNSIWYKYTATGNQAVTFSAVGTNVVKGLSVWTGGSVSTLTQIGCATPAVNTALKVNTNNGITYFIRVGTKGGVPDPSLTIQVALTMPNDEFASAVVIPNDFSSFSPTLDAAGATVEKDEPTATCGGVPFRTVWYKYIALNNTTLSLSTSGSAYDTVLSAWTGNAVNALTQVASGCNDNAPSVTTSALTLTMTPGAVYYIRVSSKGGSLTNLHFVAANASVAGIAPIRDYFTTATPTLTWNRITTATGYKIQVAKNSSFAVASIVFTGTTAADELSIVTEPLPEGVYYFRVSPNGGMTWSVYDIFVVDLP